MQRHLERLNIDIEAELMLEISTCPRQGMVHRITAQSSRSEGRELLQYQCTSAEDRAMQHFLGAAAEVMAAYKIIATESGALAPIYRLRNEFLLKRTGYGYEQYRGAAQVALFSDDEFSTLTMPLKRRLFDYRSTIYLCALAAWENAGHDLASLLERLDQAIIEPFRRTTDEATYQHLRQLIKPQETPADARCDERE